MFRFNVVRWYNSILYLHKFGLQYPWQCFSSTFHIINTKLSLLYILNVYVKAHIIHSNMSHTQRNEFLHTIISCLLLKWDGARAGPINTIKERYNMKASGTVYVVYSNYKAAYENIFIFLRFQCVAVAFSVVTFASSWFSSSH